MGSRLELAAAQVVSQYRQAGISATLRADMAAKTPPERLDMELAKAQTRELSEHIQHILKKRGVPKTAIRIKTDNPRLLSLVQAAHLAGIGVIDLFPHPPVASAANEEQNYHGEKGAAAPSNPKELQTALRGALIGLLTDMLAGVAPTEPSAGEQDVPAGAGEAKRDVGS